MICLLAVKTTQQQLEEVQAAITAVLAAQQYSIGGRVVTRANLADLEKREEKLLQRLASEQGTAVGVATFARRGRG